MGLRLEAKKTQPLQHPVRAVAASQLVLLALDQGSGEESIPTVHAGDPVLRGRRVACGNGAAAADLHSPVSGRVLEIGLQPTVGGTGHCIVIENDGRDAREPGLVPLDWEALDGAMLIEQLAGAGIAGMGGGAFPATGKLALARAASVDHLLLNGAECEPWICCDDALLRERAADVVLGARVMLAASGAARCTIVLEDDMPEAALAIEAALAAAGDDRISSLVLDSLYPLGAERSLIEAATGLEVPHDALPPAIGVLCQNVGTAASVAGFVRSGEPLVRRIVTVTGSGVRQPANLEVPIGTQISSLVTDCGGYQDGPERLIAGGSMAGRALASDAAGTTKGLNCIVVATAADLAPRGPEAPCIRCGDCARVCPAHLLPQQLHRAAQSDDRESLGRFGIADCIECGCCDYVCPSHIPLTARFRAARARLQLHEAERQKAGEARLRFERHQRRVIEQAERERLAFEDARRRARDGAPP